MSLSSSDVYQSMGSCAWIFDSNATGFEVHNK